MRKKEEILANLAPFTQVASERKHDLYLEVLIDIRDQLAMIANPIINTEGIFGSTGGTGEGNWTKCDRPLNQERP